MQQTNLDTLSVVTYHFVSYYIFLYTEPDH
jgi:hypothetical protein